MHSALGVREKLARSLELLLALDHALDRYRESEPIRTVQRLRPDGRTVDVLLEVTQQPPLALSLLVGEVVHQMRSALDHLAYALVLSAGNEPTLRTSFPVARTRPAKGLQVDGGVADAALARIEELQPYKRPDPAGHPLAVLNELWNIDKHRHLNLTVLQSINTRALVGPVGSDPTVDASVFQTVVGDGGVIGVFEALADDGTEDLELTTSGSSFLGLAEAGPWLAGRPVPQLLEELHGYVTRIVLPRLEPLLDGSAELQG